MTIFQPEWEYWYAKICNAFISWWRHCRLGNLPVQVESERLDAFYRKLSTKQKGHRGFMERKFC